MIMLELFLYIISLLLCVSFGMTLATGMMIFYTWRSDFSSVEFFKRSLFLFVICGILFKVILYCGGIKIESRNGNKIKSIQAAALSDAHLGSNRK